MKPKKTRAYIGIKYSQQENDKRVISNTPKENESSICSSPVCNRVVNPADKSSDGQGFGTVIRNESSKSVVGSEWSEDAQFQKEVADYFSGKNIKDADKFLWETARNNFKEGYNQALQEVEKIIDKIECGSCPSGWCWKEELRTKLGKLKDGKM